MMKIRKSYNYDDFSFINGNRNVIKGKVGKLVKSIKQLDLTMYNPILVTKTGKIVDGQHRFEACKELNLPIYYVVIDDQKANEAMILLNRYQSQWRQLDFLNYDANNIGDHYKDLYDFYDQNKWLGISNVIVIYPDKFINATQLREATAEFGKNVHADSIVNFLSSDTVRALKFCKRRDFVLAVRKAFDKYSNRQLMKLRRKILLVPACINYKQYLKCFENLIIK